MAKSLKRKTTRSSISETTVKAVIRRIAEGETLAQVARSPGMPSERAIRARINQSSSLRASYAHAREERAERMADEILEIADDATNDYVEREGRNGATIIALAEEHVRRSALRIDTRKFLLAKLLPHRFGERVEHTGAGGGPINVEHTFSPAMLNNIAKLRGMLPSLPAPAPVSEVIDVTPMSRDRPGVASRGETRGRDSDPSV